MIVLQSANFWLTNPDIHILPTKIIPTGVGQIRAHEFGPRGVRFAIRGNQIVHILAVQVTAQAAHSVRVFGSHLLMSETQGGKSSSSNILWAEILGAKIFGERQITWWFTYCGKFFDTRAYIIPYIDTRVYTVWAKASNNPTRLRLWSQ